MDAFSNPGSDMNVSSTSSSIASLAATQVLQPQQVGTAADPDGSSTGRPHRMHGGGHMRQAVMQALQSLGLTPPAGTSAAGASGAASTSTSSGSSSSDSTSSTSGTSTVQQDMQQFMHALFEAVKSESASGSSASSSSGDPQSSFATGLSSLISQVSSGSAPAGLQGAFSKLESDLQASGAATSSTDPSSSSAGAGSVQATLQAFLTNLQQDLGYGSSNASAAVGSLRTAQV
jgi:hypothetical protein